jgi:hypothetical protein
MPKRNNLLVMFSINTKNASYEIPFLKNTDMFSQWRVGSYRVVRRKFGIFPTEDVIQYHRVE